jgi:putative phosphoribosyl transferase
MMSTTIKGYNHRLLTEEEEEIDLQTRHLRFDIGLLAQRLIGATDWLMEEQNFQIKDLSIGYFGASTGAVPPDIF